MKALNHRVLAEGEVTGHAHRADSGVLLQNTHTGALVLDACDGAAITHEEHGEIRVSPGKWDVAIVKEYDHAAEAARNVAD